MSEQKQKLRAALMAALEWIDAVPSDLPLPTMPGFDRDEVNDLLAEMDREDLTVDPLPAKLTALGAECGELKKFPDQIVRFVCRLGTSEIGTHTKEKIIEAAGRLNTTATTSFMYEVKALAVKELLMDADGYAPMTAEQWETLVNNWYQTYVGLSKGAKKA
ncbi:TPA: hypothetical protein JG832_002448 [Enterobacter hormaechei subsp. xiangfangensis]|nr:hypothetical protein [Enterobacter hormaechei subsp. xiangfangensis]HAV1890584.1 hypothetical protein [Enterobacter hormaechei subsp. xiangfangensis]